MLRRWMIPRPRRGDVIDVMEEIRAAQAGDVKARERVIVHNVGLVYRLSLLFNTTLVRRGRGDVDIDDLVAVGLQGLDAAITKFDTHRGIRFSTYAYSAIKVYMIRVVSPKNKQAQFNGSANADGTTEYTSIDAVDTRVEAPAGRRQHAETIAAMREALASLSPRSQQIIVDRFLHARTLDDAGTRAGITKERARQVQNKALQELREYMEMGGFGAEDIPDTIVCNDLWKE